MTGRRLALVAGAVVVLCASTAAAQSDTTRARELFQRGVTLMENQDWGAALVQLEESFRLHPTQVALFDMGLCLKGLRRYREAIAAFERLVDEFSDRGTEARVALARTELDALRALFGTVRVEVRPAGAEILVDGELVGTGPLAEPVALVGGTHVVQARLAGHEAVERQVAVVVGANTTVELALAPVAPPAGPAAGPARAPRHVRGRAPPPRSGVPTRVPTQVERIPTPTQRIPTPTQVELPPFWFWSAVAVAGAGAVTTAVLGSLVISGDADYRDSRVRLAADREDGRRLALLTDVALGVSLASAIVAGTLYARTRFNGAGATRVRPEVLAMCGGPGLGLAISGTFR